MCSCSNSYGGSGPAVSASCDVPCVGDSSEMCGGSVGTPTYLSVYNSSVSVKLVTIANLPAMVERGVSVAIELNNTAGAVVDYVVEVSDDCNSSPHILNDTVGGIVNHVFCRQGSSKVLVQAYDDYGKTAVATKKVTVHTPVSGTNISCPLHVAQGEEFNVTFDVPFGTNMDVALNMDDGNAPLEFHIQDAAEVKVGLVDIPAAATSQSAAKIYFQKNYIFKTHGYITRWKYNSIANGDVYFQVFRPTCTSGNKFCLRSYTCISETANCNAETSIWRRQCTAKFDLHKRACPSDAEPLVPVRPAAWSGLTTFDFVAETQITVSQQGVQTFSLPKDEYIAVQPGDVIAVYQPSAVTIAISDSSVGVIQRFHNSGTGFGTRTTGGYTLSGSEASETFYHHVQAVVTRNVTGRRSHSYSDANLSKNVSLTVRNRHTGANATQETVSCLIDVQAKVANVCMVFNESEPTNGVVRLSIPPHPGNKVYYEWHFGDDSYNVTYNVREMTHVWTTAGVYNVTMYAYNDISSASCQQEIIIQDTIENLTLTSQQVASVLTQPSKVTFEIAQGTNVTWDFVMSDGATVQLLHDETNNAVVAENLGLSGFLNHTFQEIGNYSVTVTASNLINSAEATVFIPIQCVIAGMAITPPLPVLYMSETIIQIHTANGSNAEFNSTFNGNSSRNFSMADACTGGVILEEIPCSTTTPLPTTPMPANTVGDMNSTTGFFSTTTDDLTLNYTMDANFTTTTTTMGTTTAQVCTREVIIPNCCPMVGYVHIIPEDYDEQIGCYDVTVTATNLVTPAYTVNATVCIDYGIEDLNVVSSEFCVTPNTQVCFNYTVTRASTVSNTIDYQDGTIFEDFHPVISNDTMLTYCHSWSNIGTYVVNFTAVNPVDRQERLVTVKIEHAVEDFSLDSNAPVAVWPNGTCDAFFTIAFGGNVPVATDAYYEYEIPYHVVETSGNGTVTTVAVSAVSSSGNDSSSGNTTSAPTTVEPTFLHRRKTYLNISTSSPVTDHDTCPSFGTYNVTLNISNCVSYDILATTLVVDEPILGLAITADPYFVVINTNSYICVEVTWGSRLNVTLDYGDGTPLEIFEYNRTGSNCFLHNYTSGGNFTLNATAVNSVSSARVSAPSPIIVQVPVDGFKLTGPSMGMVLEPEWMIEMEFHLLHENGVLLPSDAFYNISFGDGNSTEVRPLEVSTNMTGNLTDYSFYISFSHRYYRGDRYTVSVEIFNLASKVIYPFVIDIYEKITNLQWEVYSFETVNSIDVYSIGFGPQQDYFPLEKYVYMNASTTKGGGSVNYTWNLGDGSGTQTKFGDPTFAYLFLNPGTYNVTLNASNPLSWAAVSKVITLQKSAKANPGIVLEGVSSAARNTTFLYQVVFGGASIPTDACYFFDFKDSLSDGGRYAFLGDQSQCQSSHSALWASYSSRFTDASSTQLEDLKNANPTVAFSISVENIFQTTGVFNLSLQIDNIVSRVDLFKVTGVTRGPCQWPQVSFDLMKCQVDCDNFMPNTKRHYKSEKLDVEASVKINCSSTKISHYTWTVHKLDCETLVEELYPLPDLTLYSSDQPLPTLTIPPNTLPYGCYKFTLNVSMDGEIGIENVTSTYVRIVKSPLHCGFAAGQFSRRKWGTNFTIDALTNSYDPDVGQGNQTGITYKWLCRRACEELPKYNANYTQQTEPSSSTCDDIETGADPGGCFRFDMIDTPGIMDNWTTGEIIFNSDQTYELKVIELTVVVQKDDRVCVATHGINVTMGDPPDIDIVCKANCAEKLNPKEAFTTEVSIKARRRGQAYEYQWELMKICTIGQNPYTTPYWPHDQWIGAVQGTGITTSGLYLDNTLFQETDRCIYHLIAKAWRPGQSDNYGENRRTFTINEPPRAGNCTVVPSNGSALETKYNVECFEDFLDEDLPLGYKLFYRITSADEWSMVDEGPNPFLREDAYLPQGNSENSFILQLKLEATDAIKGVVSIEMTTTVNPPAAEVMASMMGNMTGPEGYISTLSNSGDIRGMMQTLVVLITYMNINNQYEGRTELMDSIQATNATLSELLLVPEADRTDAQNAEITTHQNSLSSLQLEYNTGYNAWLVLRTQIRTEICQVIGDLTVTSLSITRLVISGVASIVQITNEITYDAVASITTFTESAYQVLYDNKDDMEPSVLMPNCQMIQEIIGSLTLVLNNLGKSGDVLQSDINAQNTKLFAVMDDVTDLLASVMVTSQPPITVNSSSMNTNITRIYPEDMNSQSAGNTQINFPPASNFLGTGNETSSTLCIKMTSMTSNPFSSNSSNSSSAPTSPTTGLVALSMTDDAGSTINATKLDVPVVLEIKVDNPQMPEVSTNYTTPTSKKFVVHKASSPAYAAVIISTRYWDPPPPPSNETDDTSISNTTATNSSSSSTNSSSSATLRRLLSVSNSSLDSNSTTLNETLETPANYSYMVYVGVKRRPTEEDHDFNCSVPRTEDDIGDLNDTSNRYYYGIPPDPWTCYIPGSWINQSEPYTLYWGVRLNIDNTSELWNENLTETGVGYQTSTFFATCVYWSDVKEAFVSDGCEVGPLTTVDSIQCICYHLSDPAEDESATSDTTSSGGTSSGGTSVAATPKKAASKSWFGGGFSIPMNTIDFTDSAFNKLDENPIIFATMIGIVCFYMVMCIWARKQDKIDELKAGTSPLPDNDPRHKYLYELLVYTGGRSGGGTTAKVSMVFTGDEDETEPRLIDDDRRRVFERGGVDCFLMACPRPLGQLAHIRVWHDNSGKSPSWFFSRLQVTDLQTKQKFFFICDRWFAVEEDDGLIDRVIPLAGKEELTQFNHLFWTQTKKNLYDGHIWFSIFTRPRRSKFTRVQRLSCVLSLLFTTMLSNIMFYKADSNTTPQTYKVGPFSFTLEGIITGIIASLIVFPINLLIVQLFRLSKEKPKKSITESEWRPPTANINSALDRELEHQKEFLETGDHQHRLLMTGTPEPTLLSYNRMPDAAPQRPVTPKEDEKSDKKKDKKKKKTAFRFPWWGIYIGYVVCFISVVVSIYFTTEFGGPFGAEKSAEWMASFFISLLESVCFTQPIKVFILAVFYALIIKNPDTEDDAGPEEGLKSNEEYLHKNFTDKDVAKGLAPAKAKYAPEPPDEEYLKSAREQRFKEMAMMQIIREILVYLFFLYMLFTVSYGNRDPWSYFYYSNVEEVFSKGSHQPDGFALGSVRTQGDVWKYINQTVIPGIFSEKFYDGQDQSFLTGFLADYQSYRVGAPRLRLVRTKPGKCAYPISKMLKECRESYSMFGEDEDSYQKGWKPLNTSDPTMQADNYWRFRDSGETDGYPVFGLLTMYGGGGYVAELGTSMESARTAIKELYDNRWVDRYARALFVEFVVWNPNVNLFAISSIAIEFPESGGAWPFYKVQILRLDRYYGTYMFVVMACELITIIFIIYFLVREIRLIKQERREYFKKFWNVVEFTVVVCLVLAIVMCMYRLLIGNFTSSEFKKNKHKFVNFQYVGYWDEMYGYFLAILVFLAVLKSMRLLRFNKRMSIIGVTLKEAGKPMITFGIVFFVLFFAYAQLMYNIFGHMLLDYSTFITCCETMFSMMLNKFDFYQIDEINPFFARIVFVSFMVIVSFIMVNLFLTLIMEAFAWAKFDLSKQKNDYEIVDFMVSRFKGLFGMSTQKKPEPYVPSQFQYVGGDEGNCEDLGNKIDSMIGRLETYLNLKADDKEMMKEMKNTTAKNKKRILMS
ncbi:uncharacterized protein LOC106155635 isoform X1 [Lingula anatina]|uniref:Uncharacterized protein LOC106155635 isoform X1 n=1 Tax=Lingula anatina TaxID=7574 RepID=A0A1S3HIQ6_LINAN|nr:uncharacterized protein LOC106155635 isoform X1 [Lingula anatina]|eukprot:XP_013386005.1 uncharacterized protein LOC106155635 isoform X1 [Lingula anatina]